MYFFAKKKCILELILKILKVEKFEVKRTNKVYIRIYIQY